jgi:sialate O-acetylesterase
MKIVTSWIIAVVFVMGAGADIKLSALFSDGMVLQRNKPVIIWGQVDPNAQVTVRFGGMGRKTYADENGDFKIQLKSMSASSKPRTLFIESGSDRVEIQNVLVGEVWLCSGQSNMEWTVQQSANYEEEQKRARYPHVRMITVKKTFSTEPEFTFEGRWKMTTPEHVGSFSAVGYYFGRELHEELNVPIGLISSAWGGTAIHAWSSMRSLEKYPKIMADRDQKRREASEITMEQISRENQVIHAEWKAAKERSKTTGEQVRQWPKLKRHPVQSQDYHANLFNGMIHPLQPYALRGVIWYQGEANAGSHEEAKLYRDLLENMTMSWRADWNDPFSFYAVQLVNFMAPVQAPVQDSGWAHIRQSFLDYHKEVERAGIVVGIDVGDAWDIHPKDKQTIGYRLAQQALVHDYGFQRVPGGPIYQSIEIQEDRSILHFSDVGSGLMAKHGEPLRWFAVAGEDRVFLKAKAEIVGETVVVHHPEVNEPKAVRYAWANNPEGCNLFNKEGFPASPFRTDDW